MVDDDNDLVDQIRDYAKALDDSGTPITPERARERAIATWSRHRRRRRLMVATAVVILVAAASFLVKATFADDSVTDDAVTTAGPSPRDLWELADRVADLPPTTVLGETAAARYSYRRVTRSTDRPGSAVASAIEETWVSIDGGRRQVTTPEDDPDQASESVQGDPFTIGGIPVRTFVELPDDADAVAAAATAHGTHGSTTELVPRLVDALGYAGLPGPARAGALRTLDSLGMVPAYDANPGPHLLRVAMSVPDGWSLEADFDLRTGMAVAWKLIEPDGAVTRLVTIEVDLRRSSQGHG